MNRPNKQEELNQNIYKMAQEELKDLETLQKEYNKTNLDEGIESMEDYRDPLSMDTETEVNILLSWGGPSDGYKLKFDKDQELLSGVYWYADWGTYAESELSQKQLDLVYQIYMYGDASSFLKT